MPDVIIASDTGPLISLEKINGGFSFIRKLYTQIIIPPAVASEVSVLHGSLLEYVETFRLADLIVVQSPSKLISHGLLHQGEIEAISLAMEHKIPLLIEEDLGRRVAKNDYGIRISGIVGQIYLAFQKKLITRLEAQRMLEKLLKSHRIGKHLFQAALGKIQSDLKI